MLTFAGLAIIFCVVATLLSGRVHAVAALAAIPLAGALVAGFSPGDIAGFFGEGMAKVSPVAAMFVFAILFFGVMDDAGIFRPIIGGLVAATRGNVVAVAVGTGIAGMLAHLDGAGATTFLLTIPAIAPLYRRLGMDPYLMLMLLAIGAGIFNMFPWAGPLGRAAAVTGVPVTELWRPLIPVQACGAILLVGFAAAFGFREQRRLSIGDAAPVGYSEAIPAGTDKPAADQGPSRPMNLWLNGGLLVAVIASLVAGSLPAAYIFMLGLAVALPLNYKGAAAQSAAISAHAANALSMAAIIFAAGAFLGVLSGAGMLTSIAGDIARILPTPFLPWLHIALGIFGLPMELVLNTDAYYFGLLPVVAEVVAPYGVSAPETVYALMVGNIIGTFISPFSPALWLALGLSGLDMGAHIRRALLPMWAFSLALMAVAAALGVIVPPA
ncbi:MAG: citrate transporter [Alphaproteobacteria bacterium]|nr:citrate transporter [Alphaproteobacteria bacterium]